MGWYKLFCLLMGIADGASGVSSAAWQYAVVHYLNKACLEMLIFLLGNDVALEEFKGKNAQIMIFF